MLDNRLNQAVETFTALMHPLSEEEPELTWIWKDHDEEGVRFALFVTLQELRSLAVTLSTLRSRPTPAQHILSQYHTVQIDKTLDAIGQTPSEAKRLLRRVFAALAEAEGMMIGVETTNDAAILETASSIEERTKEIRGLL